MRRFSSRRRWYSVCGVIVGLALLGALLAGLPQSPVTLFTATPPASGVPSLSPANGRAPTDMPSVGAISSVQIPATLSGFVARDAQVYLPPAALVPNPPALPFVLMMMGQPGEPDAGPIKGVLDAFAAQHGGLAPIVVVADQLGDPNVDSLCLDTDQFGQVETYLERDVVNWARGNLHIQADRVHWTVAGFSNGGQCAISLAAKYPQVWGNVIDASGTTYAGIESETEVLADVFGGDQTAYDATKPATVLAAGRYPDSAAVFTVGTDDQVMEPGMRELSIDAQAAGLAMTYYEVPGEGHSVEALTGGLTLAFDVLSSRLGLG
ncbi:hypothetical protein E3O19_06870 [Cryobacterium algoritolerans]|uniref:Esterase n=1 Tax=Cryobacterium algoritolerans TaxID=1259184 RepID=A0A4R8WTY2_9MICO|nr:alpha/beta hydrolase-fold protein [Cryobacterium algoritolerans]TFC16640.1 hypothetical protein E3O19_06870 [Cryobacterium algoritolerans]